MNINITRRGIHGEVVRVVEGTALCRRARADSRDQGGGGAQVIDVPGYTFRVW